MNRIEANLMKMLKARGLTNFPKLLQSGNLSKGPGLIMQRFGQTLDHYLTEREDQFSFGTTMQIGIQMVQLIEDFHSIGCVHNDLKLDNICVGLPR